MHSISSTAEKIAAVIDVVQSLVDTTMNRPGVLFMELLGCACSSAGAQTLEGFARLPADTFAAGPTSGQFIAPATGRVPPFLDEQPVQGISAVLRARNGDFWVMPDGFGAKDNSADYVLRMYRVSPRFRTKHGGSGAIVVKDFITLRDPDRTINFAIVADRTVYPNSAIPVDPRIQRGRWLTGADFDIESVHNDAGDQPASLSHVPASSIATAGCGKTAAARAGATLPIS